MRHGQSTANVLFARARETGDAGLVVEGRDADVALSPQGVREGQALGRWWVAAGREGRPGLVISSPYARARETWGAMSTVARESGCGVPDCLVDERLRDREMGVLELLPPPALSARAPEERERRERVGEWFYRPPGGESLADVTLRVRDLLTELRDVCSGDYVLLVAHDAVVLAVRQVLAGVGAPVPDDLAVPNASVSRWDRDTSAGANALGMRMVEFGSVRHLQDMDV